MLLLNVLKLPCSQYFPKYPSLQVHVPFPLSQNPSVPFLLHWHSIRKYKKSDCTLDRNIMLKALKLPCSQYFPKYPSLQVHVPFSLLQNPSAPWGLHWHSTRKQLKSDLQKCYCWKFWNYLVHSTFRNIHLYIDTICYQLHICQFLFQSMYHFDQSSLLCGGLISEENYP